jgi:hypothetical protein
LNAAARRYYYKQKAARAALGLTTRGTPRIFERHHIPLANGRGQVHGQPRANARARIYTARLNANGFSSRGNPKRGLVQLTPLETNFRIFRAAIPAAPASNWENIERI